MPIETRRVDGLASQLEHSCRHQPGWMGKGLWIPAAARMTGSRDPNGLRIPVATRVIGDSRIIERPWRPPAVVAIFVGWVKIYAGRHPILVHSPQTLECRPLLRSASCQKRVPRVGCRRSPAEAFWPSWDWGPRQWPWFPHLFSTGVRAKRTVPNRAARTFREATPSFAPAPASFNPQPISETPQTTRSIIRGKPRVTRHGGWV